MALQQLRAVPSWPLESLLCAEFEACMYKIRRDIIACNSGAQKAQELQAAIIRLKFGLFVHGALIPTLLAERKRLSGERSL